MHAYDLRRGWAKKIEGGGLQGLVASLFGSADVVEGKVVTSFGAIDRLTAWTDGKSLFVDTVMNPKVDEATAVKSRQAWNAFLEQATGYNAKQRQKRVQDAAKEKA